MMFEKMTAAATITATTTTAGRGRSEFLSHLSSKKMSRFEGLLQNVEHDVLL
jgi:hypothetical protein